MHFFASEPEKTVLKLTPKSYDSSTHEKQLFSQNFPFLLAYVNDAYLEFIDLKTKMRLSRKSAKEDEPEEPVQKNDNLPLLCKVCFSTPFILFPIKALNKRLLQTNYGIVIHTLYLIHRLLQEDTSLKFANYISAMKELFIKKNIKLRDCTPFVFSLFLKKSPF
jgi:hypothetical protein